MATNPYETAGKFLDLRTAWKSKVPQFQSTVKKMYGEETLEEKEYNPFLDKDGNIFNKYIDYQKVLDNPDITSKAKEYISKATGLNPTETSSYSDYTEKSGIENSFDVDPNKLVSMDVTQMPKLSETQISSIITNYFSKSTVIKPSDAAGIYNAQQKTGMSALAILGIGALESGYGTSAIAKQKNNIWGWNATNVNPAGNAKTFSKMSKGALEFATAYMNTYYNKYGAKSIFAAGTGNNPAKKGYAYYDDGKINLNWATSVGKIMKTFYHTATGSTQATYTEGTGAYKNLVGKRVADTAKYNNGAAKGQCVWYVLGRVKEKFGKNLGFSGNGNSIYYNAGSSAKLAPTKENIKPDMLVSYKYGTSKLGQIYGHVIYVEDVIGDTVYYTEGGSGYYKSGTDGVIKTTTRQGLIDGVNNNGVRMGSSVIGFVDVSKCVN